MVCTYVYTYGMDAFMWESVVCIAVIAPLALTESWSDCLQQ